MFMGKRGREKSFLKENWLILIILIILAAWFSYSYFTRGIVYSIIHSDVNFIINWVDSFGFLSYLIFVLLVILEVILAPIPPLVLYIAGGILFGAFFGGILVLFGNVLGAGIAFLIARKYGRKIIKKKLDKKSVKKFDDFSEKYGGFSIFLLRINPFTSSDLFSYFAGLSKMKIRLFLFWTGIGLIPLIFIQTYLGEFFIKQNPILSTIVFVLSIFYLVIFIYLVIRVLSKKSNS
jgi:uncharacterized membrane protein YdjX (TVP38/TMEM64 family)